MTISDRAKEKISTVLREGEQAVDATLGNGWDTVFLAQCVGASGRVFGFDVQEAALHATQKRLAKAEVSERCKLFLLGHEKMADKVSGPLGAVMFNLGYLPYAGEPVITQAETTKLALGSALTLLRLGGVVTVICYVGHVGGREEAEAVLTWAGELDERFTVDGPSQLSQSDAPFLLVIEKRR